MVIHTLQDVYSVRMYLENERLGDCRITATFNDEPIEEITQIIAETFGTEASRTDSGYVFNGNACYPNLLLLFLLTFFCAGVSRAQQIPLLERKISIPGSQSPVDEFPQETGVVAGCTFSYATTVTRGMQPATLDHRDRPLRELLDRIFSGKVNYKERGTHVILLQVQPVDQEPEPPSSPSPVT